MSNQPVTATALPERWVAGRRRAGVWCLVGVLLLASLLARQGGADQWDGWWLRLRFSVLELLPSQQDPQIVLVELDDKTLDAWQNEALNHPDDKQYVGWDTSLRWAGHIARAADRMQQGGVSIIGLDWIQPVDFDNALNVQDSQQLGGVLSRGGVVLVKELRAHRPGVAGGSYQLPAPSLRFALPDGWKDNGQSWMGFAEISRINSIQTSFYPYFLNANEPDEYSFAARVAEKAGANPTAMHTRRDGTMLINYASGTGLSGGDAAFTRYSLCDVENGSVPPRAWKGKIALIGTTFQGNNDAHFVPFSSGLFGARLASGLEMQANAVATLLRSDPVHEAMPELVWLFSLALGGLGVLAYASASWGRAAFCVVGLVLGWAGAGILAFAVASIALPLTVPLACLALGAGSMGTYRALSEERERAEVLRVWGRHQDPRLISELLAHPEWRGGEGREHQVTVLFADLKNFTKTVESLPPAKALEALNRYLALLSGTILEHGGILDKYLGDGLMAQWCAPTVRPDHANAAVRCCLHIQAKLEALTPELQAKGEVTFGTRLTLHTGTVVAGPLGSNERLEYTIIGDTVNVTSRLQETAKELGCDFLISETTREACTDTLNLGREAEVEIRGRVQPLKVYEVLGGGG